MFMEPAMSSARFRASLMLAACLAGTLVMGGLALAEDRSVKVIEGVPELVPAPDPAQQPDPTPTEKAQNPAGVAVEVLPGLELKLGSRIAFRVTTQKPGYLLLVDVDAAHPRDVRAGRDHDGLGFERLRLAGFVLHFNLAGRGDAG